MAIGPVSSERAYCLIVVCQPIGTCDLLFLMCPKSKPQNGLHLYCFVHVSDSCDNLSNQSDSFVFFAFSIQVCLLDTDKHLFSLLFFLLPFSSSLPLFSSVPVIQVIAISFSHLPDTLARYSGLKSCVMPHL